MRTGNGPNPGRRPVRSIDYPDPIPGHSGGRGPQMRPRVSFRGMGTAPGAARGTAFRDGWPWRIPVVPAARLLERRPYVLGLPAHGRNRRLKIIRGFTLTNGCTSTTLASMETLSQSTFVRVDGRERQVTDRLSSGPGLPPTTYELRGGAYVYEIGGSWWLQERGQFKRKVTLEAI